MFDLWAFLLQTLTASGVAALLLLLKALFQDKLPPKWQFAVWSVLALMLLLPAGYHGRYVLVHWQVPIEMLKAWCGDFGFTQVYFPLPFVKAIPTTVSGWLFVLYTAGVIFFAAKYMLSYISLRQLLRRGRTVQGERLARIEQIADAHDLKLCRVVEVSDLPSAFVCGILRPVLAIPASAEANSTTQDKAYAAERGESTDAMDEKVLLHELFHLKHRDTFWSALICLLRCIHWCNPLLAYCADRALNDMESRCDQYVLEHLEGEARRDYGRILLAMANEKFARTPGSTCINNGGSNIRRRIEAIARFKKYPQGMRLVSGCMILVLAFSMVIGTQPEAARAEGRWPQAELAAAKTTPCTTYAGALDTYAKSMLEDSGVYRYMCAPAAMQAEIWRTMTQTGDYSWQPEGGFGLHAWFDRKEGYYIYNLRACGENAYTGLLVMPYNGLRRNGLGPKEDNRFVAVQNLRVKKEGSRWVVEPLEDIRLAEVHIGMPTWGSEELPSIVYAAEAQDIRTEVRLQTVATVENYGKDGVIYESTPYDTVPRPHTQFSRVIAMANLCYTNVGDAESGRKIKNIGIATAPVYAGETVEAVRAGLPEVSGNGNEGGSSTDGPIWVSRNLEDGLTDTVRVGGGGGDLDPTAKPEVPQCYAANLYLNGSLAAQLTLRLQEGETK